LWHLDYIVHYLVYRYYDYFVLRLLPQPCPPLFPYTTLFRSQRHQRGVDNPAAVDLEEVAQLATTVAAAEAVGAQRLEVTRYPLRSEEHTSELQSRENLVCRLLLEKKKIAATISWILGSYYRT